jgi:ElaB/YqjD/DUF883 family membrane-anchored ribosome-binding protein
MFEESRMSAVTKDKLIEDLKVVANDVEELLRATANQTGDKVAAARARAEESLRGAKARLKDAGEDLADQTRKAVGAADDYVRDNPWQSIAVAAGVGFLVGILVSRR